MDLTKLSQADFEDFIQSASFRNDEEQKRQAAVELTRRLNAHEWNFKNDPLDTV